MKRAIVVFFMLCFIVPITMEAKKKQFGKGLYWELSDNSTLIISGIGDMPNFNYSNTEKVVKAPWMNHINSIRRLIVEEGVTSIGNYAFFYEKAGKENYLKIEELSFPSTMKRIGSFAFYHSRLLKKIDFNEGLISIGDFSFDGCYSLKEIHLPSTLITIGASFRKCNQLQTVVFSDNLKEIDMWAFSGCTELKYINFPKLLNIIGEAAFSGCNILSLELPVGIKIIGENAFKGFKGEIVKLPNIINSTNAEKYGLSKSAVENYQNSIKDNNGRVIVSMNNNRKIEKIDDGKESVYYIVIEKKNAGITNGNGKWIIPLTDGYSVIEYIGNRYIRTQRNGYYGIMTLSGKEIIPTSRGYTSICDYDSFKGTFVFTKKGFSGVCDAQGREISTTKLAPTADDIKTYGGYTNVSEISNGSKKYWKVSKGGRYGLTDSDGKEIVPCEMEALESAGTGYLKYKINGFWGVMNYTGKILIDTDRGYTSIGDFKTFNKRFPYTMAGYKGECDINGKQISKIKVETPKQTVASSSSSSNSSSSSTNSSSSSNSGSGTTQTVVVEHHRDPMPVQEWQQCVACYGSGQCPNVSCGGSGWYYIGDRARTCSRCHGSGKCTICAGKGGNYITVYR